MPVKAKGPKKTAKKTKAPPKTVAKDSSSVELPEPTILKLTQTLNQLISYTESQFNKINLTLDQLNQRLENLESINKIKPAFIGARKKINLNTEKLFKIIEELSRNRQKEYITFDELRQYITRCYIVENQDWEQNLEILKKNGQIEFSKGAKTDLQDEGYKDAFNKIYYYFKLK